MAAPKRRAPRKKPSRAKKATPARAKPASLTALRQALARQDNGPSTDLFGVVGAIRDYYHDWQKEADEAASCARFARTYGDPALLAVLLGGYLAEGVSTGHSYYFTACCRGDAGIHRLLIDLFCRSRLDKSDAGTRLLDVMRSFRPDADEGDVVALDDELRRVAEPVGQALEAWISQLMGLPAAAAPPSAPRRHMQQEAPTRTMSIEFMTLVDSYQTFWRTKGRAPTAAELAAVAKVGVASVASQFREIQDYVTRAREQAARRPDRS